MNIVVLDSFPADQGDSAAWDPLRALGKVVVHSRTRPTDLVVRAENADALLTNKVLLDPPLIERLPKLRYVGVVATGTNAVSLSTCRERGIAVTNVPGYSTHSVAQLVFALVLQWTHDVAGHDRAVKSGRWAASPDFMFCLRPLVELAGKTLTIVGMGAIGGAVAEIGRAFGMHVIAAAVPGSTTPGRVPLHDALAQGDVVTLHCPLTPSTRHIVNRDSLARMKPGAVLINTGRGALIDEAALLAALEEGRLGGVGLDVLEREPPAAGHPLLDANQPWSTRLVVTPHLGWATVEARERLITEVTANLAAFVRGESRNRVERADAPETLSLPPR
ncbi:MAG TPA: D-2-hydroxyacid dehydrogenase [Polyangiaceae bacterium]|jgi:glycerate dehydrogenase|nr:D-2-hydroxyacid dehydrogenase [Polyangiaceae bacterium]